MRLVISASAAIIKDGKILLSKRSQSENKFPGYWSFAGGKVDNEEESLADAAVREVKEEIGLDFKPTKMFGFFEVFGDGYHSIAHVFLGDFSGTIKPNKEEVEECRWFSYEETKSLKIAFKYGETLKELHERKFI